MTCCGEGTAGWGDAGTVVPWALYRRYGDTARPAGNYDAMKRWIAYLQANSTNLIRPNAATATGSRRTARPRWT